MYSSKLCTVAVICLGLLAGCEAPPKNSPATASGKKVSVVDTSDDTLIRIYHAQNGAPAMYRDTVLTTLAANRSSSFSAEASAALGESDAELRDQRKNSVFKEFKDSTAKATLGGVIAIPVTFTVMPYDAQAQGYRVCIDGICANPYVLKQGVGAYKLDITVTPAKFLVLPASASEAKQLESRFEEMGREGNAVLYATVERVNRDARYAPTIYAAVYRVALKDKSTYDNPSVQGIYWSTDVASIAVGSSP